MRRKKQAQGFTTNRDVWAWTAQVLATVCGMRLSWNPLPLGDERKKAPQEAYMFFRDGVAENLLQELHQRLKKVEPGLCSLSDLVREFHLTREETVMVSAVALIEFGYAFLPNHYKALSITAAGYSVSEAHRIQSQIHKGAGRISQFIQLCPSRSGDGFGTALHLTESVRNRLVNPNPITPEEVKALSSKLKSCVPVDGEKRQD